MAEEINVLPGARPEIGDIAGIPPNNEIAQLLDHRLQHAGALVIEREDQVLTDDSGIAMHENEDAAAGMQLPERAADRLVELYGHGAGFDAHDFHAAALIVERVVS